MSKMNRKPFALLIVLLIAALAPASAIIGFCTRMPCCSHASDATAAFSTERDDCCTTIACSESPSAKLTNGTASSYTPPATPALVGAASVIASPTQLRTREIIDTSPPASTRHRLAILSTLLI